MSSSRPGPAPAGRSREWADGAIPSSVETAPPTRARLSWLPWAFAGVAILGQVVWPLVPWQARTPLTGLTVVAFFLATASHCLVHRGAAWSGRYLALSLSIGWAVEALGTATGVPFGHYSYTGELGPALLQVPLLIPLAWSMMAYPCLLATQRLVSGRVPTALVGGLLLTSWDVFLDPQMVAEGYWVWHDVGWTVPGIPEIPATNFAGWFLVASLLMAALSGLPRRRADDAVPTLLLSWVYLSNVLAAAMLFDRPAVALWGAVLMGLVVVPWWCSLARTAT